MLEVNYIVMITRHNIPIFKIIIPQHNFKHQGPVVKSIVKLTSLLRGQLVKYFTNL